MNEGARKTLQAFEAFLGSLDLASYRKKYQRIETVEQNLPRNLSPLPDLYKHYWKPAEGNPAFPSFEDFFNRWWDEHLEPLNAFRQRYFWGCSCEFVRLGFEARLYRTAISIWTQFHFCYRWLASCSLPLKANQERDAKGMVVSRCMCKRLCTGGIPLLKHLLQRLPRLREPFEPQDVRLAKQLASSTQDTG